MKKKSKMIFFLSASTLILLSGFLVLGLAGHIHHQDKDHEEREGHRTHGGNGRKPVSNSTYKTTCGGCHLAYPPKLLPSASWQGIVSQMENHFGEQVPINPQTKEIISRYLMDNGANRSSSEEAIKIMKCLRGKTPLRITEIPYIRRIHQKIPLEVFNREKIGTLSNCLACHQTADQGIFDDDVTIRGSLSSDHG
jgi:hypothetical protein